MNRKQVGVACLVLAFAVAIFAYRTAIRPSTSQTSCRQNMRSIGIGLLEYHKANGRLPSAMSSKQPRHSWRVDLLPWIGEEDLYQTYDQSLAWDAEANQHVLGNRPDLYACPEVLDSRNTSYQVPVSVRSAWPYDTPLSQRDFIDGTGNTFLMMDVHKPQVEWTSLKDLTMQQTLDAIGSGQQHSSRGKDRVTQILMADGSVKQINNSIDSQVIRALLTPAGGRLPSKPLSVFAQQQGALENDVPEAKSFAAPRDAIRWDGVTLLPAESKPIIVSDSLIYCPTFTLAWNAFTDQFPQLSPTPLARGLAQSRFTSSDISSDSVVIDVSENSVRCELKKQLAFMARFDAFKKPLTFTDHSGKHLVRAFGITSHWTDFAPALSQIRVHDYRSADDFIISIANDRGEDLILAKIDSPDTLLEGIHSVSNRINMSTLKAEERSVVTNEQVVIPVLEVSVMADFRTQLQDAAAESVNLEAASQIIQFRLDERGAIVWSEAQVIGENGHYDVKVGNRTFIFDKPFFVMLRESSEQQPYLAAWIGNTELMFPHK